MTGIFVERKGLGALGPEQQPAVRLRGEPIVLRRPETKRLASLSFAADKDYLALARMTAMHVAGLLGLPIGRVTDLRLAVDEACTLFLAPPLAEPAAAPGRSRGQLTLQFDRLDAILRIRVSGPAPGRRPDEDDLGWTMLCALVGEPRWEARDGIGTLTLTEQIPTGRR